MAFTIFSGIPDHVVSVQTDMEGTFEVVGVGQAHGLNVDLAFAQVHVSGAGITQAQRMTGIENGSRLEVTLLNNTVRINPRP